MQIRNALTALLLALCYVDTIAGREVIYRRQDASSVTSSDSTPSTTPSPVSSTATSSLSTKEASEKTRSTASTRTQHDTETSLVLTATPTPTSSSNGTASRNREHEEPLPLKPSITPALGIAGVVMLITGAGYAIIGIKHQWLSTFLSAAYLAALGVTVLIIYVMSPPVSDAIQGAYMVAALMTGLIFGGICLVFKDVAEGLGCLLGGFCIAMWFLVLSPGGLLKGTTEKAIFIGVFSAVGWSLSFSQHTRNYGLILCTAFAGSTITILGIDCFSRAGLKEFWIYIWALNENEFPLHTTTYPITRGIRVEIAGIIILFLFSIMSQIKIWKIVKDRRTKKEERKLEEEAHREQRDSQVGKKVNKTNERSLAEWEAVYGDKDSQPLHTDSGVGTSVGSMKRSTSVTEREVDTIEMDDIDTQSGDRSQEKRGSVMVRVAADDEESHAPELDLDLGHAGEYSWWTDFKSNRSAKSKSRKAASSVDQSSLREASDRPPLPQGPTVVPPPFSPPDTNSRKSGKDLQKKAVNERRGVALGKLPLKKHSEETLASPVPTSPLPPSPLPRIEDDRASSIAATAADDLDARSMNRLSVAMSLNVKDDLSPFSDNFKDGSLPRTPGESPVVEKDDEELVRPPTAAERESGALNLGRRKHKRVSASSSQRKSTGSASSGSDDEESANERPAIVGPNSDNLPESISKVAMAYRTNEWAKHIAEADQPEADQMPESEEPGVQVDVGRPEEAPRRVEPAALLAKPPMERAQSSQVSIPTKRSSSGGTPVYGPHTASLARQSSSTSIGQSKRETRNSSAPLAQTLVESPIEEDVQMSSPYRASSTPLHLSTNNLLDERSRLVDKRPTTANFNGITLPSNAALLSPSDLESGLQTFSANPSQESLTLAQRKSLLDQGQIQPGAAPQFKRQSSSQRPGTSPAPAPPARMNSGTGRQNLIYDSHQPKRSSTVNTIKQNEMLTQWRQSLQHENQAKFPMIAEEQQRQSMINQHQAKAYQDQRKEAARARRESQIDVAMRTGQLTNAHQNALKKMQAKANKATKE